jgi:hypothetical protein
MTIALIGSAKRNSTGGPPYDTETFDSTDSTLLVYFGNEQDGTLSLTDSKSNSITPLSYAKNNTMASFIVSGYVNTNTPTVGAGHYATLAFFYYGGVIAGFSGTAASPFDNQQNQTIDIDSVTSLAAGSVTPSVGGCLVITALELGIARTVTQPTGYDMLQTPAVANSLLYVAYKIKDAGDTSAENPEWTWTGGTANAAAKVAVFKPAPAPPVLTLPTISVTSSTAATAGFTSDTATSGSNIAYFLTLPAATAAPADAAALIANGATVSQTTGGTNPTRSMTGLTVGTSYRVHMCQTGSNVVSTSSFYTVPVLSSPTATKTGTTTATGTVSTDANAGTLYYYMSTNTTETNATIKASGSSQAISGTGQQNVSFTGLTPATTYYAHYVQTVPG